MKPFALTEADSLDLLMMGSVKAGFPSPAEEVKEIISMNRAGRKAASLKGGVEVAAPEFVTAVGDDSITRFDAPKKRKSRNRGRAWREKKNQQKAQSGGDAS